MKTRKESLLIDILIICLLIIVSTVSLLPVLHVFARSFSSEVSIAAGKVGLLPIGFQLDAYKEVIKNGDMMRSMAFTIYLTVLGTAINVLITALGAYPLSQKDLPGRKIIWMLILFTMFFSGGLIPLFLVVRSLGILDTVWAMILPTTVSTFNLILMKTFFQGLPDSLLESARMDGCPELHILFKIVIPLSTPILATLCLFYGMTHWNEYFQALIYMTSMEKFPIQMMLQRMIGEGGVELIAAKGKIIPVQAMQSAAVFFVLVPVLVVFPFIQKHFTKGALLGSIKE